MAYHYRESGLDNVVLENGYTIHQTPYGDGVSIKDTAGLHKLIGSWLTSVPKRLNGAELRFLRLEMEVTQRRFGELIGMDEQAVRRWEKYRTKPIPGPADRLTRALYNEYIGGDGSVRALVDRLAELDCIEKPSLRVRETKDHWQLEAA